MKISANFRLSEFDSKDGAAMPADVRANIEVLAANLQIIREHIGEALTVTSGYRSPEHNKSIGGATKSFHIIGKAADIKAKSLPANELAEVITELMKAGTIAPGGIGLYSTWVHYDTRGKHIRFR